MMIDKSEMEAQAINHARPYCARVLVAQRLIEPIVEADDIGFELDTIIAACIVGFRRACGVSPWSCAPCNGNIL